MTTSVSNMQVATPASDHVAPGPPAVSNTPPVPPGPGPVPAPFLYIARSATADQTCDRLKVGGQPVLVVESGMAIQQPGNVFAKPCEESYGADILTRAVNCRAAVATGLCRLVAGGVAVAGTGAPCYMNVPTDEGKVSQARGVLWAGIALRVAASLGAAPGAIVMGVVDPVSAATGEVYDTDEDIRVAGLLPLVWERSYSSRRCGERTPFGIGGWTHSLHRWIDVAGDDLTLRDERGNDVATLLPPVGDTVFLRSSRIEVRRLADAIFEVYSLDTRLVHRFEPLAPGGRAVLRGYRDAWLRRVDLTYTGQRLSRVVLPAGRELRIAHDSEDRIVKVELWARGGPWQSVSYAYNAEGELAQVEQAGERDTYGYDGAHRLIRKTLPTGLSFHYEHGEDGRCIHAWGDGGLHEARFDYDLDKGITRVTGNPEARVYTWDQRGAITSVQASDGSRLEKMVYDDDLKVLRIEDEAGTHSSYEHDARGNLIRQVGAGGAEVVFGYEGDLRVLREDGPAAKTLFTYDSRGALVAVTHPSGQRTTLEYDEAGRLLFIRGPEGPRCALTWDDEDNAISETGALGETFRYTYDALGRVATRTDPLGRVIKNEYDALGRLASVTHPDGTVLRTTHDALGRCTSETNALGHVTRHVYGGVHSLIEHHAADGAVWTIGYDRLERARLLTNAKGETWEWRRDRAGRVVEERPFDGRILRYQYGPNGQLSRVDRPDGTWRAFAMDGDGRKLAERSTHGGIHFERDKGGRVKSAVVDDVVPVKVTMTYDDRGRLIEEVQDGLAIRYAYDAWGRVTERLLPSGQRTRFLYDSAARLRAIEHEGRTLEIAHDVMDNEVRRTFLPAGVDVMTERDVMERITRQLVVRRASEASGRSDRDARGPAVLLERSFDYDARGWLRSTTDSLRGSTTYEHDVAGQLVGARRGGAEERYSYDVVGSLTEAHWPGRKANATPWSVAPGNVLVRAGDTDFVHDAMRRRVAKIERRSGAPPERTEYLWDCRDRLREVRFPDGSRVVYFYDAWARRLRKEIYGAANDASAATPARTVRYLWQGSSLAAEIDSVRGTRVFVHGPGSHLPLLEERGGAVFAYVCGPTGTPEELIDERGTVSWRASRTAWGVPLGEQSDGAPPFRLLGQYADDETDLCYVRNRYFDPATARFLSPDPLGLLGGRNLAAFNGSPVVHVDPDGLRCALGNPAIDHAFFLAPNLPPKPGYYDVVVHGYPNRVVVIDARGRHLVLTPAQLAQRIAASGYQGGPIRLISCNTGQAPNGFAKQLAIAMNVTVEAPTGYAFPPQQPGGPILIQQGVDDPTVPGGIRYTTPGTWQSFLPDPVSPPPAGGPTPSPGTITAPMPAVQSPQPAAASPGSTTAPMPAVQSPQPAAASPGSTTAPMPAVQSPQPASGSPGSTTAPMPAVPAPQAGSTSPGGTAPPQPAGGGGLPFLPPGGSGTGGSGSGTGGQNP